MNPDKLVKKGIWYLASPYSHKSKILMHRRYLQALRCGANLTKLGFTLLEPIAMSHNQAKVADLPTGYEYWQSRDRQFIEVSAGVLVLNIDGWDSSRGVTDEIHYALSLGKPVYLLDYVSLLDDGLFVGVSTITKEGESHER